MVLGLASPENATATRGMVPLVANKTHAVKVDTSAPSVVLPHTVPSNVMLSPELLIVNTLFIPDEWEKLLNNITPFNKFSDVPISLRLGFNMEVHIPPSQTYTPPNHKSALSYLDHVLSHIHK